MSSDSDDWDVPEEGTFRRVDTEAIVAAEAAAEADAAARAAEADEKRALEAAYEKYSADEDLIATGTVRGSTRGAYLAALQRLRDEVPGHYWVAVFPPA